MVLRTMNVSDIIATVGLVVSVVGIPLAFFLARRTRQRPELRYAIDFDMILRKDSNLFDRGLYMTLGNHRIDSISRSRFALWNHRGDTIEQTDILKDDPLRVQLEKGDEALQARVLGMSREQVAVTTAIDASNPSSVLIDFRFLDGTDGAIIEIIHRGPSKPTILGTLKGADMRNVGPRVIGSNVLDAKHKSRARRWVSYVVNKRNASLIAAMVTLLVTFFIILLTNNLGESNHLINVHAYKLNTINGQVAFAQAVSNTKAYNASTDSVLSKILLIGFICVLILGAVTIFLNANKRKLPWNLTAYRVSIDAHDKDGGTFNEREGARPSEASIANGPDLAKDATSGNAENVLEIPSLTPGDKVVHEHYGPGVVQSVQGAPEDAEAIVDFDSPIGRKHLVLRYAPLKKG